MRLFTYIIVSDDGAAPNPFNGMCSLAICKPAIRRVAKKEDWIVGLGSKNAPTGDLSNHVVYAMKVEEVLSMRDYDIQAKQRWPHRIPKMSSNDIINRLGDCIYDYSKDEYPNQRIGVHANENKNTDLSGKNVLISEDYYYYGKNAIKLPEELLPIVYQGQGHRSNKNDGFVDFFDEWIRKEKKPTVQLSNIGYQIDWKKKDACFSCASHKRHRKKNVPRC